MLVTDFFGDTEDAAFEPEVIDKLYDRLSHTASAKKYLLDRGITEETAKWFELGYERKRIIIPIKDIDGNYVNCRKHSVDKTVPANKKVISVPGYGKMRLFPLEHLNSDIIMLCEGELDTILANQYGLPAMTVTSGAGSWNSEWNPLFNKKEVYICYDNDIAGRTGARKVAEQLYSHATTIKIIELPVTDKEDVTDYFVKYNYTVEDLMAVFTNTSVYTSTINTDGVSELHLSEASKPEYVGRRVLVNTLVTGKHLAPFTIPSTIHCTCSFPGLERCVVCPINDTGGELEVFIEDDDPRILLLLDATDKSVKQELKKILHIPAKCAGCKIDIQDYKTIEEILVIPEVQTGTGVDQNAYVMRKAYYVGHGIETNRNYRFEGLTIPNPRTQEVNHLFYQCEHASDEIASFQVTDELIKELDIFRTSSKPLEKRLAKIYRDLSHNVTCIYGRDDLHFAIDLAFFSPLSFIFGDKVIHRGWADVLILGDTRTGKTETVKGLINHYRAGDFMTSEGSSFAGLVGGLKQTGKNSPWTITWGKIPLNDRRLVAIDEASGLNEDEMSAMSGIRSSGVAEITKIHTERTHARTRLIWLSNPKAGNSLSEYTYGVSALGELFEKAEDVARLDFVVTAASHEVSLQRIIDEQTKKYKHEYTSDLCHKLVLWAWSRKPENVVIHPPIAAEIYRCAAELSSNYSAKIPLVLETEQHIKIARLAIALAMRLFSTNDGQTVVVRKSHVQHVTDFLHYCYSKGSLDYYGYSNTDRQAREKAYLSLDDIKAFAKNNPAVIDMLRNNNYLRARDMAEMLDLNDDVVKAIIKFLITKRLLQLTGRGYRKTVTLIELMKNGVL